MKGLLLIVGLVFILFVVGCQTGGFKNNELGVSMDLPKGWVQGEPRASGGFRKTSKGGCFQDMGLPETEGLAWGCIDSYPLEKKTFDEYIANMEAEIEKQAKMIEAFGKVAGQMAKSPPETPMGDSVGTLLGNAAEASKELAIRPKRENTWAANKPCVKFVVENKDVRVLDYYINSVTKVIYVNIEFPMSKVDKYQPIVDEMVGSVKVR